MSIEASVSAARASTIYAIEQVEQMYGEEAENKEVTRLLRSARKNLCAGASPTERVNACTLIAQAYAELHGTPRMRQAALSTRAALQALCV